MAKLTFSLNERLGDICCVLENESRFYQYMEPSVRSFSNNLSRIHADTTTDKAERQACLTLAYNDYYHAASRCLSSMTGGTWDGNLMMYMAAYFYDRYSENDLMEEMMSPRDKWRIGLMNQDTTLTQIHDISATISLNEKRYSVSYKLPERENYCVQSYLDGEQVRDYSARTYANAGKRWDDEQLTELYVLWLQGNTVNQVADNIQRTPGSVISKLREANLIEQCDHNSYYHYRTSMRGKKAKEVYQTGDCRLEVSNGKAKIIPFSNDKEIIMAATAKPVEIKTFIYGNESKNVSDEDIFGHISTLEGEIKKLEAIENKPKKLVARIDDLKADIAALVKVCDERSDSK